MYARVFSGQLQLGKLDEATRLTNGFLHEQLAKLATVVVGQPTTERFEVGGQE